MNGLLIKLNKGDIVSEIGPMQESVNAGIVHLETSQGMAGEFSEGYIESRKLLDSAADKLGEAIVLFRQASDKYEETSQAGKETASELVKARVSFLAVGAASSKNENAVNVVNSSEGSLNYLNVAAGMAYRRTQAISSWLIPLREVHKFATETKTIDATDMNNVRNYAETNAAYILYHARQWRDSL